MKKENKIIIWGTVIVIILVTVLSFMGTKKAPEPGKYDAFTQCLTQKGAVMYGAYWCPHCQANKAALGDSVQYINYVECTEQTQLCTDKGIQGFPTWIVGTSTRIEGFVEGQTLQQLSDATGCELPQ